MYGYDNTYVPKVDSKKALQKYKTFSKANKQKLISSAISVHMGGLGVALSKMAIASQLGLQINLSKINSFGSSNTLFSESQSRILISIKPSNKKTFEKLFANLPLTKIGKCISNKILSVYLSENDSIEVSVNEITKVYKKNIKQL